MLFADEAFLSPDEDAHERYRDEAVAAEKFSHRFSRTIKRTHAAKFERYGRQRDATRVRASSLAHCQFRLYRLGTESSWSAA